MTLNSLTSAAVIEAVNKNPQITGKLVRGLPHNYIVNNFNALERVIVSTAKRSSVINVPLYMWTYPVHAAFLSAGVGVEMYPAPLSKAEALSWIS